MRLENLVTLLTHFAPSDDDIDLGEIGVYLPYRTLRVV